MSQIRLLIAEWMLGIIVSLCPANSEGTLLLLMIRGYFSIKVKQTKPLNGHGKNSKDHTNSI